jgi:HlyD family secretion protein
MADQSRLKRILLRVLVIALLIVAAAWAYRHFTEKPPVTVTLYTVDTGPVETLVSNTRAGTVKACRRAKLAPQTGGQIVKIDVREGQRVEAGQVLMELWGGELTAQMAVKRSQLASAKARAEEACTLAANAERESRRSEQLRAKGFVSAEAVERALAQAESQAAACTAARTDIRQQQANIRLTEAQLSRTRITAPFAGIVAEVTGEEGEFATPSPPGIPTPPAVDLIDDSCLYVSAPIDEVDAPKLAPKLPARISLDAWPGRHFPGHVRRIAPYVLEVEKQARTVEVEVEFDRPEETPSLLVGLSADVEIIADRRDNVLRVPTRSILEGGRVLVYDAQTGVLHERRLTLGAANWEYTEVAKGIGKGDRIVLSLDKEGIKDGARAQPES